MYDYLAQYEGIAFLREEDEILRSMAEERPTLQAEYYSEREAEGIEHHLEGIYNRYNVAAAAAIGRYFCIEEEAARRAIGSYLPDNNRSQREERSTNTLIIDCYNANPSSMQASIENFLAEPLGERKERVQVLGDMRELGRWSEEEHLRIIRLVARDTTARVIFVGEEFGKAIETIQDDVKREHYATCEELYQALKEQTLSDSLVLIKASRGIGLERIIELL